VVPTISPTAHPQEGALDPFTPSADEIRDAEADILARVIPGGIGAIHVAHAKLAERAVMLADDVTYGNDPAVNIRRIRALDSARRVAAGHDHGLTHVS
jgi:hypothetical protein